jgi:hypothetical protein
MTLAQSEYDEELRLGEQIKMVSSPVGQFHHRYG